MQTFNVTVTFLGSVGYIESPQAITMEMEWTTEANPRCDQVQYTNEASSPQNEPVWQRKTPKNSCLHCKLHVRPLPWTQQALIRHVPESARHHSYARPISRHNNPEDFFISPPPRSATGRAAPSKTLRVSIGSRSPNSGLSIAFSPTPREYAGDCILLLSAVFCSAGEEEMEMWLGDSAFQQIGN
jgi:hypothetical protein